MGVYVCLCVCVIGFFHFFTLFSEPQAGLGTGFF